MDHFAAETNKELRMENESLKHRIAQLEEQVAMIRMMLRKVEEVADEASSV